MEEYRIDLKVRNNLILNKIEALGYQSPHQFCDESRFPYGTLLKLVNMQISIFDTRGRIRPIVVKLCDELDCQIEEIFSAVQMESSLENNKRTLKVKEAEMKFFLNQSDNNILLEHIVENDQLKSLTEKSLDTVTPTEKKVIQMRFGMDPYDHEHTFGEISELINLSRERVRQIEAKALRKLRHPNRSQDLRGFIYENQVLTEKEKSKILEKQNKEIQNQQNKQIKLQQIKYQEELEIRRAEFKSRREREDASQKQINRTQIMEAKCFTRFRGERDSEIYSFSVIKNNWKPK